MNFGITLLEFRARNDLTQKQIAEILGVGIVMISRYENQVARPTQKNKIRFEQKMKEWEENNNV